MKQQKVLLDGRSKPVQQRAIESVETILSTAATLLDEVGLEGFNTNLLAERADVRVRTVYRYFPNKYAVIIALTEMLAVQWDRWMQRCYQELGNPAMSWRAALKTARIEWLKNAKIVPGALSVLQAMHATPELEALHIQIFEDMSGKVAAALRKRGLRLPPAKLMAIGRMVVNAMNTGTEVILRLEGLEARQFSKELSISQENYLASYLGSGGTGDP